MNRKLEYILKGSAVLLAFALIFFNSSIWHEWNGDRLMKAGEYYKAVVSYKQAGSQEKMRNVILKYTEREDLQISLESKDYESASELAKLFTDIDTQLFFCHALYDAGYDIQKVYPVGVTIDIDLRQYSIERLNTSSPDKNIDTSGIIILRREQLRKYGDDDISSYSVKLLPASMFGHEWINPAKSINNASCIIILDGAYIMTGYFEERTYPDPNRPKSYTMDINEYVKQFSVRTFPYYSAVNNITAYDAKNPLRGYIMLAEAHAPYCAEHSSLYTYSSRSSSIPGRTPKVEERFGSFDYEEMTRNMDMLIALFVLYRDVI